jgi:DeoR/GlpR family transcriptional regulator of sugar metabolism
MTSGSAPDLHGTTSRPESSRAPGAQHQNLRPGERHDAITEMVLSAGSMRIDDLAEEFGVSMMTVHRDLDTLEARGVLRKSRGSVTALASSLFESSPEYRAREHRDDKEEIATAAFDLVEPGQALILDDSTTGIHLAKLLPLRQPLTVITNFRRVLDELLGHPGLALISLGGQHYQWCDAYMGALTHQALQSLRADVLFMSTPAITDDICFHQHHDAAMVKKAMFESAAKRVLMVDHSKFTKRALHAHMRLVDFDVVIVDARTEQEDIDRLRDKGINVLVAGDSSAPDTH